MDATWDEIDVFPGRGHGFGPADVKKNFKLNSYGNIFATVECPQRTPRLLCEPFDLLTEGRRDAPRRGEHGRGRPAELRTPAYKRRRCAAFVELLAAKDAARDDDDVSCPEAIKKGTALGRAAKRGTTVLELCDGALPSDSRRR